MRHVAIVFLAVVVVMMVACTYAADECKAGEEKFEDCNHCHCAGGQWGCTRKHCVKTRETTCNPGETFKMDCNTCTCSSDGKNAACTFKLCPK